MGPTTLAVESEVGSRSAEINRGTCCR